MKIKPDERKNIDSLLKGILKDDIPPSLENRLRKQIIWFKRRIEETGHQPKVVGLKLLMIERQWKRIALSFASLLLVIVGGFLKETGTRHTLADCISAFHTAVAVNSRMRRVDYMDCVVRLESENGLRRVYSIKWDSNGIITVASKDRDGTFRQIIEVKNGNFKYFDEPQISQIFGLISPLQLTKQWQAEWRLRRFKKEGNCLIGTFAFTKPPEVSPTEMKVNMCTYLPYSIIKSINFGSEIGLSGRGVLKASFAWGLVRPIPSFLLSMKEDIK